MFIRTALLAIGAALLLAVPASAKAPGVNGRIVFDDNDGPMYTVNPDGSGLLQITFGHDQAHWSGDGSVIAVDSATGVDERVTSALLAPDGSSLDVQTLPDPTINLACVTWAPGDAQLACEGWDDANPERLPGVFAIQRASWAGMQRLTTNTLGGHDIAADYSPDGSRLAFLRENPAKGIALHVLDIATGDIHRIGPWQHQHDSASWSPDGRRILFADGDGHLFTIRPDGSDRQLIPLQVASRRYAGHPGYSPDGKRIVFSLFTARNRDSAAIGIYTASVTGGDVRLVVDGVFNDADWGPTSK
jgi:Tol biopolymer transport system component